MLDDLDDGLKRLAIHENCKKCCKESKMAIIHTDTNTLYVQEDFFFLRAVLGINLKAASVAPLLLQPAPPCASFVFVHVRECGIAPGTLITVSHLFNSVPARRKFLKTDATESAHIIQTVRLYALACPATAFVLIEDGRVLFQSPVCATLGERVGEIFGRQLVVDLLPVAMAETGIAEVRKSAASGQSDAKLRFNRILCDDSR